MPKSALTPLSPDDAAQRLADGRAVLVDIREPNEFVRRRARGALSRPLSSIDDSGLGLADAREVIFTCRSGGRTRAHGPRLAELCGGRAYVLEGGLDAWDMVGLPIDIDSKAPLELMRQVQIAAGLLVLVGVGLGLAVSPWFLAIAALVGAALTLIGVLGSTRLLAFGARTPPPSA